MILEAQKDILPNGGIMIEESLIVPQGETSTATPWMGFDRRGWVTREAAGEIPAQYHPLSIGHSIGLEYAP